MGISRARLLVLFGVIVALGLMAPGFASAHPKHIVNPYAQGAPWRNGAVPKRGHQKASGFASTTNMSYGGGISDGVNNVGVTTGAPRVYLVFWGSQWGTQGTDPNGNATFSGDPNHAAPYLQMFLKGLGTGGETWSGVMTQYCQGVAVGTTSCPSSAAHVGYPTGGALAGVWEDTGSAAPAQATAHQLGQEAINAATHFGNTSQNSNRDTQYVIVSPTGTSPDGYMTSNFCAWHDYTGDSTMDGGGAVSSSIGMVAFTNLPYLTDVGASCGQNFVNSGSAGTLDGFSIVEGHEYAETITDQYPAGGWTDSAGNENGDKCAWISSGQGASQNVNLTTGSFAVQSTWANDYSGSSGGCEVSHPIVGNPSSVSVSPPGNQSTTVGAPASLQMNATDSNSSSTCCSWSISGLPSGFAISSTGLITGNAPTTAGSSNVTVTATDSANDSGSTSFTWSWAAGPAAHLTVSPSTATVGIGGSQTFTASATDQYYNPVSASQTGWTTNAPGSLSGSSGSSTTFTGSGAGTGSVNATLNGLTASASVTVNATANPIGNGGFETGSLTPWTASGATGSENVVSSGSDPCYAGSYCAMLGLTTPTNANSSIAQTFTAPSGSSSVSFYYDVVCTDTVRYDWATASLRDITAGKSYTVLGKTCTNNGSWANASHSVTPGHRYTLTLTNRDDNYPGDPTYTLYDNVSVQ